MHDFLVTEAQKTGQPVGQLGISVCGYSAKAQSPEVWDILFDGQAQDGSVSCEQDQNTVGVRANGQPEAIFRLLNGFSPSIVEVLNQLAADPNQVPFLIQLLQQVCTAQIVHAPMPIQDAIDLVEWLVHTTEMYSRFTPEPPTVGGPIEIAVVTKHEGFKWVKRKLFYDSRINPIRGGQYEDGWAKNGVQSQSIKATDSK